MQKNVLKKIPAPLLAWYGSAARRLPWRELPSPYRTLVSEFMLQQTRIETVLPYFYRFLEALPDIRALSLADEQTLLKLWEGLGYYSRVRNLQKAARMVMEEFGGEIPSSYRDLLRLPGVGPYTAGAIASIAFGLPVPAVDGNVLRVVSRITASREDIGDLAVRRAMEKELEKIIPEDAAGNFNQALMELGALICLPGDPKCAACPLSACCAGYGTGIAASLPVRQKKPDRKLQQKTVFVLISRDRLALLRRPKGGLLGGLWALPSSEGFLSFAEAGKQLTGWGLTFESLTPLSPAKHIFTHVEWQMQGYLAHIHSFQKSPFSWACVRELQKEYPLPSAYRFYLKEFYNAIL
jgi:A/G-specific adenine glycosylase